ncbi:MAG TPA: DNA mismatch repair endonuclease MutL [Rikenellaceae bacterium]|nr:DNA mismatch repair endonuclease MutL [Rikenellaceae bacterium]
MIHILPGHITNLIAAGEVVQRPASVVKEMLENAVDAGADSIQVIIKDSGRTLIQVTDNGSGMSREEAKIAFQRHATSKIETIEDLNHLNTYGFRGEALASVAAVSEVTLRTRRESDEIGCEIKFAESSLISEREISTPKGSNFIVRNLFYNVPARRKFLKSDATEFRQIVQEFSRVAFTRPDLSLRLVHNDIEIFHLSPANLKKRILDIAGKEMGKELVHIHLESPIVKISGFTGKPEDSRKTPGNQYFFVNNRYFRSPYFQKAVVKAYENLIKEETIPSFFIFLEIDPERIDVNIHPSKTEVKFEDEFAIYDMLHAVVRESLGRNSLMPSIDFDIEGAPEIPAVNYNYYAPPPKINFDPLFNPFEETFQYKRELMEPFVGETARLERPTVQVAGRYIITAIKSGLLIINIKRARERIFYEKYLDSLNNFSTISIRTLFPKSIELDENTYNIILENAGILQSLGFDIRPKEDGSPRNVVEVMGLPENISDSTDDLLALIDQLVYDLTELGNSQLEDARQKYAATLALSAALCGKDSMNNQQAQLLIDTLFACREPSFTPSGKPCSTIITLEEIDKRFI